MFIALRDLRFARGRFVLLGSVIALMSFIVVMLGGLTAGLGAASISAVDRLPVNHLAFQQPAAGQGVSFTNSALPADAAARIGAERGVRSAHPVGVSTAQLTTAESVTAVTVIGTDPALFPARQSGRAPQLNEIAVTKGLAADQHLHVGDQVTVAGQRLRVVAVVAETSFNHLPVLYSDIATWQGLAHTTTITAVGLDLGTAVATAVEAATGVQIVSKSDAFAAVGAYSSEQGSLNLMRILLIVVSALVIGSFFTVWTMQRAGDLAVARALGASRRYLLGDALGQAAVVLVAGAAVGAVAAIAAGLIAAKAVPFLLTTSTVALALGAMLVVGLLGATIAVRRVSTVDPLTALGAAR